MVSMLEIRKPDLGTKIAAETVSIALHIPKKRPGRPRLKARILDLVQDVPVICEGEEKESERKMG